MNQKRHIAELIKRSRDKSTSRLDRFQFLAELIGFLEGIDLPDLTQEQHLREQLNNLRMEIQRYGWRGTTTDEHNTRPIEIVSRLPVVGNKSVVLDPYSRIDDLAITRASQIRDEKKRKQQIKAIKAKIDKQKKRIEAEKEETK